MFVNLKDNRFRETMKINIGGLMFQFAVSHPGDRAPLLEILGRHGKFVQNLDSEPWVSIANVIVIPVKTHG